MSEFKNFTEKDYQSYINLLRLAFDAVLDAKTLEDAKKKASWATVAPIHSGFGEFEIVQAHQQIADLESQLAEAQRQKELLRAVVNKAYNFIDSVTFPHLDGRTQTYLEALQTAIDGGALEP